MGTSATSTHSRAVDASLRTTSLPWREVRCRLAFAQTLFDFKGSSRHLTVTGATDADRKGQPKSRAFDQEPQPAASKANHQPNPGKLLVNPVRTAFRTSPQAEASLLRSNLGEIHGSPITRANDARHHFPFGMFVSHDISPSAVVACRTTWLKTGIGRHPGRSISPVCDNFGALHFDMVLVAKRKAPIRVRTIGPIPLREIALLKVGRVCFFILKCVVSKPKYMLQFNAISDTRF